MTKHRLRISRFRYSSEAGFTIVEVMVAILILLVGVLGTVALIDGANRATSTTKAREGGVALTREVAEVARLLDFDQLECASENCVTSDKAIVALQGQQELADTAPGGAWTVVRRGITYTVNAVQVCKVDVAQDKVNTALRDSTYCTTGQGTGTTGDGNPDDYRRLRVTVSWNFGPGTRQTSQTALISNPTGGLGPRVTCFGYGFGASPCTSPAPNPTVTTGNTISFKATTTFAASVHWETDEGTEADATGSNSTWAFDWNIGSVPGGWPSTAGSFDCGGTAPNWVLDGTYLVSVQGFNDLGIPGQQRSGNVTINRSLPARPCDLAGGYNDPGGPGVDKTPVIDLQWSANKARDVKGYRVYRGAIAASNQVCPANGSGVPLAPGGIVSGLSCFVTPSATTENYFLVSVDCTATDQSCEGPPQSATVSIANDVANNPPGSPTGLTGTASGAAITLSWTAATDPDGDPIQYYRIYRGTGGTAYTDRYATADCCSFQDNAPSGAATQYFVSTVDSKFAESVPVGPVP